jgi:hypothetical protein
MLKNPPPRRSQNILRKFAIEENKEAHDEMNHVKLVIPDLIRNPVFLIWILAFMRMTALKLLQSRY